MDLDNSGSSKTQAVLLRLLAIYFLAYSNPELTEGHPDIISGSLSFHLTHQVSEATLLWLVLLRILLFSAI